MKKMFALLTAASIVLSAGAFAENTPANDVAAPSANNPVVADASTAAKQDQTTTTTKKTIKHKKHTKKHHNTKTC